MFDILNMGAGGLVAQRTRMDTIAQNVLNINTTKNEKGEHIPFRRKFVTFQAGGANGGPGVHVKEVADDPSPFNIRHDPGHPDADPVTGNVLMPNVDLSTEYVNMLEASRAYEANITMMETAKQMFSSALRLIA
ncbi:MAG: flgC [Phycisphaerales bacterium]|nr:flgC [Phycisphaerales bacterium]